MKEFKYLRLRCNKWLLRGAVVALALMGFLILWGFLRPFWLTQVYSPELEQAVQRYFEVSYSLEGLTRSEVLSQVATGKILEGQIQFLCRGCPSIPEATKVHVETLWVLDYSDTTSKAAFRIEYGIKYVDPKTQEVQIGCHATAHTEVLILRKELGIWKVENGANEFGFDRDPVEDSPELHAKYCQ